MKKLFSALIILASVLMLSGCFFYVEDNSSSYTPPKYNFYFKNDTTNTKIRDFYLEDRNGNRYSKGNLETAYPCEAGETLVIKDLSNKDYLLIYQYENSAPIEFGYFPMDSDKTFVLSEKRIYKGKLN